jgi:hypothetical protein
MRHIPIVILALGILLIGGGVAQSETLSAQDIFDKMIHYEYDQLSPSNIADYSSKITETSVRGGTGVSSEVIEKTQYYMVPMFQLELVGNEPVFYFDQDLMLILLDSVDLIKQGDTRVGDVDCYVIISQKRNPAFRKYFTTYYVAKDDFRHVQTISHHASEAADDLVTTISYTYGDVQGHKLLQKKVAETKDANGNLLATTTAVYSDYSFSLGLTVEFFTNYVGNRTPTIPGAS